MTENMQRHLLITARSFGKNEPGHVDLLREDGFTIHEHREGETDENQTLYDLLPNVDAWVVSAFPVTEATFARCDRLRVIVKHGVGVDNIDVQAASRRGIAVLNAPGSNHVPVADLAMTHLLCFTRRIVEAHQSVKDGKWERFLGTGVHGKTLGILGVGRIGKAIAERALGFGITCTGYDPYLHEDQFESFGIRRVSTVRQLLETADFLSINVPLTYETQHIISDETIGQMKAGAIIINTSRGSVVDEDAIVRALRAQAIGGYATDVYEEEPPTDSPLLECPNVLFTPHVASYTGDAMRSLGDNVIQGIRAIFANEVPEHILNPEVFEGRLLRQ